MIDREHLKQLISAYVDGETNTQETEMVEDALARDAELKKYYQDLIRLSSSLQNWQDEPLSPDLEKKIDRAYRARKRKEEGEQMKTLTPSSSLRLVTTLVISILVVTISIQIYTKPGLKSRMVGEEPANISSRDKIPQKMVQGRLKSAADNISASTTQSVSYGTTNQYEPYYLETSYNVLREDVARDSQVLYGQSNSRLDILSSRTRAAGGFQTSVYDKEAIILNRSLCVLPQQQEWNREGYDRIFENEYLEAAQNPLSTFSIDVDTASYSNIRRFLNNGQMPPEDAVRIEEMINYFSYKYPDPTGEHPFSITTEVANCPWYQGHQLALIGLQGKRLKTTEMAPSNLVFLIDVSGSMQDENKLPLLKQAFSMMTQQLRAEDKISIVVYAGAAGVILEPTTGDQKQTILNAIAQLEAGGSTAGGAGIQMAYELAKKNYIKDGNNRVILATDGDFNVGVSSDGELVRIVEEKRKEGIFLTVLGFGEGNYQDTKMEKLADKGNGNYYYIDTLKEAKKVLVQELGSTLFTIAKDVKIQIEFNPGKVKAYRLIGYENRILKKEDFNDDTKDAGELGTGHTVTALYEIVPADSKETFGKVDDLKYQKTQVTSSDDILTVKFRYKKPDEDTSRLIAQTVTAKDVQAGNPSENLAWASSVAEFGMLLRNSKFKGDATYQATLKRATAAKGEDPWGFRQEMIELIQKAENLDVRNLSGGIGTK
jgi:Ca-activated chloride channel homolog